MRSGPFSIPCRLSRRFVRFNPQHVGKDPPLLLRKLPLVPRRIQHNRALIRRHRPQITERVLHHRLPIPRQRRPLPRRAIHPHPVLWRQPLHHLRPRQSPFPNRVWHLVYVVQLIDQPLLFTLRQPLEARIRAQLLLLVLHRLIPVLVQPRLQMSRRRKIICRIPRQRRPHRTSSRIRRPRPAWLIQIRAHRLGPRRHIIRSSLRSHRPVLRGQLLILQPLPILRRLLTNLRIHRPHLLLPAAILVSTFRIPARLTITSRSLLVRRSRARSLCRMGPLVAMLLAPSPHRRETQQHRYRIHRGPARRCRPLHAHHRPCPRTTRHLLLGRIC